MARTRKLWCVGSGCGGVGPGGGDGVLGMWPHKSGSFCAGRAGGSVVARQGHGAALRRGSRADSRCGNTVGPGCGGAGCGSVGLGGGCMSSRGR
jgi:hypothetical protein